MTEDLRFPMGPFKFEGSPTEDQRRQLINEIEEAPAKLRAAVAGLKPEHLDTPYRPGGWTVRQVVHHLPDSHMNAFIRFRLALTEDAPLIKPYQQEKWAELEDSRTAPIDLSLTLLDSLHRRWTIMLRSLGPKDWQKTFRHPELGVVSLNKNLALYAWHGRHHVAHITSLRKRMGWG